MGFLEGWLIGGGLSEGANTRAAEATLDASRAQFQASQAQEALSREQDRSTSTLAATVGVVGALVQVRQELAEEKKKTADILARVSEMISAGALNLWEKNKLLCKNYEESQIYVLMNTNFELKADSLTYQNVFKILCKKHGISESTFNNALLLERSRLGALPFHGTQYLNLDNPADFIMKTSKNEYIDTERIDIELYAPSYQKQLSFILCRPEMYVQASNEDEMLAPIQAIEESRMGKYKNLLKQLEGESNIEPQVRVQQYETMIQCVSDAIAIDGNPRICVELYSSKFRHAQVDFLSKYAVELKKDIIALRQTLLSKFGPKGETMDSIMVIAAQERAKFADFKTGFGIKFDRAGDFLQLTPRIEELEALMQATLAIDKQTGAFQATRDAYYEQRRIQEAEATAKSKPEVKSADTTVKNMFGPKNEAIVKFEAEMAAIAMKTGQPDTGVPERKSSAEAAEKPAPSEYDKLLAKHQAGYK